MPTLVGSIFIIAGLWCFYKKPEALFGLTFLSSIFDATSVIAAKSYGIQPFFVLGSLFILQTLLRVLGGARGSNSFSGKRWMYSFGAIAIASAIVLPVFFAGTPVYDPYVGIDEGANYRPLLHPALANFTQIVYLLVDIGVVVCAARTKSVSNTVNRFYKITFYTLTGIVLAQFACATVGIPFPYFLLQTHGGASLQNQFLSTRYPGTFTESSGAGAVLVTFAAGYLAQFSRKGKALIPMILAMVAIFLVQSSSSIFAFIGIFALLLLTVKVFGAPGFVDVKLIQRNLGFLSIVVLGAIVVLLSPLRASVLNQTVRKENTASYINRSTSDSYALDLFVETHGLGVGMGSNRPSSMLASLLSTVGLAGFVAFIGMFAYVLLNARSDDSWMRWAGLGLFIDASFGAPDFVQPWIWAFLSYVVYEGTVRRNRALQSASVLSDAMIDPAEDEAVAVIS